MFYTSQCVAFELMFLKQFFSQGETKLQCNNSHTSSVIKLRKPCYYMMYAPKFKKKRGWNRTPNDVFLLLVQSFLRLSSLSLSLSLNSLKWYPLVWMSFILYKWWVRFVYYMTPKIEVRLRSTKLSTPWTSRTACH